MTSIRKELQDRRVVLGGFRTVIKDDGKPMIFMTAHQFIKTFYLPFLFRPLSFFRFSLLSCVHPRPPLVNGSCPSPDSHARPCGCLMHLPGSASSRPVSLAKQSLLRIALCHESCTGHLSRINALAMSPVSRLQKSLLDCAGERGCCSETRRCSAAQMTSRTWDPTHPGCPSWRMQTCASGCTWQVQVGAGPH